MVIVNIFFIQILLKILREHQTVSSLLAECIVTPLSSFTVFVVQTKLGSCIDQRQICCSKILHTSSWHLHLSVCEVCSHSLCGMCLSSLHHIHPHCWHLISYVPEQLSTCPSCRGYISLIWKRSSSSSPAV